MNQRYEVYAQSVYPNRAYTVNEFTSDGRLWGTYTGYYDSRNHVWRLYPTYNKFCHGQGKLKKKHVSAVLMKQIVPKEGK